jgi:hypothetical protein
VTFNEVVTAAVKDISDSGFDPARIAYWQERLRKAAAGAMGAQARVDKLLNDTLTDVYRRLIENGQALKVHPGVSRFTVDRLKPKLRVELQKRIFASADLIKLNREKSIAQTLQRFSGWASSIPQGGSDVVDKRAVKLDIGKSIRQEPFETRRVLIDQGHKFAAGLNEVIGLDNGAIASIWHHHHSQYPRFEHEERDGVLFLIRDSWAQQRGFVKLDGRQYRDEVERVGEFPFCRCTESWVYNLRDLPPSMLTVAGHEELDRIKREIRARMAA